MADAGPGRDGFEAEEVGRRLPAANWPGLTAPTSARTDGGGSSTEALIGLAMGAIEAGCNTVALFR